MILWGFLVGFEFWGEVMRVKKTVKADEDACLNLEYSVLLYCYFSSFDFCRVLCFKCSGTWDVRFSSSSIVLTQ